MKQYKKNNDIKFQNRIVIVKDDRQYINPPHEMLIEDGWELYVKPELTYEELLTLAMNNARRDIESYDLSSDINSFYMQGQQMWLDKATRTGLMLRFQAEQNMGHTNTSLWYDNTLYTISLEDAFKMLYALEGYASACYDNTQRHLSNISKLETIEEIESYDYKEGYPKQLEF